jgi:hypothetical protein
MSELEQETNVNHRQPAAAPRHSRVRLAVAGAAIVLGLGCWAGVAAAGGSPSKPAPTHPAQKWGEVTGMMETGGGVAPGKVYGIPGKVILTPKNGRAYTVEVGKSGKFSVRVPVGTYQVVGYSPDITSQNGAEVPIKAWSPTVVTAGHTTMVELGVFYP